MSKPHKFRNAVLIGLLSIGWINTTQAVPVVDQDTFPDSFSTVTTISEGTTFGRAQTFTVGLDGILDSIEIGTLGGTFTEARILQTSAGVPIGGAGGSTVLATSSSISSAGQVVNFDFLDANLSVSVGDVLAIELFGSGANWAGTNQNSYAEGTAYFFNTFAGVNSWSTFSDIDLSFRTFVSQGATSSVNAPNTLPLISLALLGLGLLSRRHGEG